MDLRIDIIAISRMTYQLALQPEQFLEIRHALRVAFRRRCAAVAGLRQDVRAVFYFQF